jgi:hypothetical protein
MYGVGTGALAIALTSTSVRVWSASIFKNTSPTRRVARSPWATTTSIESTSTMVAGMRDRRHPIVVRNWPVDRAPAINPVQTISAANPVI